jgi:hypothetical protein
LRTTDPELVAVVRQRCPTQTAANLRPEEVAHIFNLIRLFISLKRARSTPLFWANTIDQIAIEGDALEVGGVCSPHMV